MLSRTSMGRGLVIAGVLLILVGLAWPWLGKIPWGQLPGDFLIEGEGFSFYFPLTSALLPPLLVKLLLWLFQKLRID